MQIFVQTLVAGAAAPSSLCVYIVWGNSLFLIRYFVSQFHIAESDCLYMSRVAENLAFKFKEKKDVKCHLWLNFPNFGY